MLASLTTIRRASGCAEAREGGGCSDGAGALAEHPRERAPVPAAGVTAATCCARCCFMSCSFFRFFLFLRFLSHSNIRPKHPAKTWGQVCACCYCSSLSITKHKVREGLVYSSALLCVGRDLARQEDTLLCSAGYQLPHPTQQT